MSAIQFEPITVHDLNGRPTPALLQACDCGGREWVIYTLAVDGTPHQHMQCTACGECYCDGACRAGLAAEPAGFRCPRCGMVSHHPEDNRRRYCGNCHEFV
jgi:hypothetical protein